ncbi:hypothetical protein [Sodalis sp. RH19]|uniref:hypothetical protein n=1 Tax=Sodalis sp. RH19 TaxID=3394334 RepID=UPI0039B4845E
MLNVGVDQFIIKEVAEIEPYSGWSNDGKIYEFFKYSSTITMVLGALLLALTILLAIYHYGHVNFLGFIIFVFTYINWLFYIIFFFGSMMTFALILSMINYADQTIGKGKRNFEIEHNYKQIVKQSSKSYIQLDVMKLLISVNLNKVNYEVINFIQMAAVLAFIITTWPKFAGIPELKSLLDPNQMSYYLFSLLIVVIASNLGLFRVFKMAQRKNSYAMSIIEAAIKYKKIHGKIVYRVRSSKD